MLRAPAAALAVALATALLTALPASADAPRVVLLPAATFAQKADAICKQENAKRARGPQIGTFTPATATKAQVQKAGKVLLYTYPINVEEIGRIAKLGLPREQVPRTAWKRLHTLLVHTAFPVLHRLARTGVAGKVKAFRVQFTQLATIAQQEAQYTRSLGFTVCGG
jgi:hypothetical protein